MWWMTSWDPVKQRYLTTSYGSAFIYIMQVLQVKGMVLEELQKIWQP